jgi:hypothetical protein
MINQPKPVTDPRILRIFEMGDVIEKLVIDYLKYSGLSVNDRDESGNQFGFADEGIAGHADGIISGLPESSVGHLLEIKSYNYDRFMGLKRDGMVKSSQQYYVQMVVYMEKFNLEKGLFIAYCKDNSEIYIERVNANKMEATRYLNRGKTILTKKEAEDLPRAYSHKSFYKCKFCDWREECWKKKQ